MAFIKYYLMAWEWIWYDQPLSSLRSCALRFEVILDSNEVPFCRDRFLTLNRVKPGFYRVQPILAARQYFIRMPSLETEGCPLLAITIILLGKVAIKKELGPN
jgi:hypothetical protein